MVQGPPGLGDQASMSYTPLEYWTRKSETYRAGHLKDEDANFIEMVKTHLPESPRILDVGSGLGLTYEVTKEAGIDVTNFKMCDFIKHFIDRCEEAIGVRPDYWDGKTLPYEDDSFDMAVSWSVMLHIVEEEEVEAFIKEHMRVAQYLFIATWKEEGARQHVGVHCFQHDYEGIFERLGLEVVEARPANWRGSKEKGRFRRINYLVRKKGSEDTSEE